MKNPFVDSSHVDNGDFVCVKNSHFYPNNTLSFPAETPKWEDSFYRTYYGYGVAHDGQTWSKSDHNMRVSMHRLTGSRKPEIPNYENHMRLKQRAYILSHREQLLKILRPVFDNIPDAALYPSREVLDHYADAHPKKALRVQAFDELVAYGQWSSATGWMDRIPELKMKTEEIAKPGKKGRTIVDLGPKASLVGAFITDSLKQAMNDHPIALPGGDLIFAKSPGPSDLRILFEKLARRAQRKTFVYHSDDSCYSGPAGYGNADISNCDGSHTTQLFELLLNSVPVPVRPVISELIAQCQSDIKVYSAADRTNFFVLRPCQPKLYSGSTLTTLVNNLANVLIGHSFITYGGSIEEAAARVGYDVTDQPCAIPEGLQFLKHSPARDINGVYQPLLNLGVLMRLSGSCKRDLPGRGPIESRAATFQQALLQGVMAHSSFPLLDRMRSLVAHAKPSRKLQAYALSHLSPYVLESASAVFTDESVVKRYDLTAQELQELQMLGDVGFGEIIGNPAIAKVLAKDYGLGTNNLLSSPKNK